MGLMHNITCFAFRYQFNLFVLTSKLNSLSFSVANPQKTDAQSL